MAAAATKASWIARQWKRGWETIPTLMVCHCFTIPLLLFVAVPNIIFHDSPISYLKIKETGAAKYRAIYTVMRSDDPRIARITHESRMDETGIFG